MSASTPTVLKLPIPIPSVAGVITHSDAHAQKAIASRRHTLERIVALKQSGLRVQTSALLARTATSGEFNYVAQSIHIAPPLAETLDTSLCRPCM